MKILTVYLKKEKKYMEDIKLINLDDPMKKWSQDKVDEISQKVKDYVNKNNLEDTVLYSVEDSTWTDPVNQRYDIWIRYTVQGHLWEKKLFMLKGEILDCGELHARREEFYPNKTYKCA